MITLDEARRDLCHAAQLLRFAKEANGLRWQEELYKAEEQHDIAENIYRRLRERERIEKSNAALAIRSTINVAEGTWTGPNWHERNRAGP